MQQGSYSPGYDLWAVPYQSDWYSQIDWWCQFFISHNIDVGRLRAGEVFVLDVRRFLPNKKTWIYKPDLAPERVLETCVRLATDMAMDSIRIYAHDNIPLSDELQERFRWSIVKPQRA
ncbi:MAG: hypothetical protein KDD33_11805 [Bdellovibrionales bacterium]|nr:hypothetical protein [Bdellovibrionales bacterium]